CPRLVIHLVLSSFPTRRSSDLDLCNQGRQFRIGESICPDRRKQRLGERNSGRSNPGQRPRNHSRAAFVRQRFSTARNGFRRWFRSEEHTSELQSRENLVCRLLL